MPLTITGHWSTPLNLYCQGRKNLLESFYDSGSSSFGKALYPWLEVNANEAMIRNLCLTIENTTESTAKTKAA